MNGEYPFFISYITSHRNDEKAVYMFYKVTLSKLRPTFADISADKADCLGR